jgi:protein CMS1
MSAEDNLGEPLLERLSATPESDDHAKSKSSKRKRDAEAEQTSKRAAKKQKSKKRKTVDEDELDVEQGVNNAFSHMDSQLLADYLAQRTRQYEGDLSTVELEDKYIPGM